MFYGPINIPLHIDVLGWPRRPQRSIQLANFTQSHHLNYNLPIPTSMPHDHKRRGPCPTSNRYRSQSISLQSAACILHLCARSGIRSLCYCAYERGLWSKAGLGCVRCVFYLLELDLSCWEVAGCVDCREVLVGGWRVLWCYRMICPYLIVLLKLHRYTDNSHS